MQTLQAQQSKRDAHYHTAHLLAIMTKLMPNWLPEELFNLLAPAVELAYQARQVGYNPSIGLGHKDKKRTHFLAGAVSRS